MKGAISCLFYGRTLACPASGPTDLMPPNISRGNRLTVLRLGDGRQATLITPAQSPGNLMRLATDTEPSDRIFFAGRLLAVPRLWCGNSLAVAGPNALNSEHPHGSPTSDNTCWDDSPTR